MNQQTKTPYENLQTLFNISQQICDPIDFQFRQKSLLTYLAYYILEKDKPQTKEEETNSSDVNKQDLTENNLDLK